MQTGIKAETSAGTTKIERSICREFATRVEEGDKAVFSAAARLGRIADRLFGERPEQVDGDAQSDPDPSGALGEIENALRYGERARTELFNQIERLEEL